MYDVVNADADVVCAIHDEGHTHTMTTLQQRTKKHSYAAPAQTLTPGVGGRGRAWNPRRRGIECDGGWRSRRRGRWR